MQESEDRRAEGQGERVEEVKPRYGPVEEQPPGKKFHWAQTGARYCGDPPQQPSERGVLPTEEEVIFMLGMLIGPVIIPVWRTLRAAVPVLLVGL